MTTLPPALTHPESFNLTPAQSRRLDNLPDDCVVVATEGCSPIIRQASGRLMRLDPNGDLMRASTRARQLVELRHIDLAFPKAAV
jgi:hypothetical protein